MGSVVVLYTFNRVLRLRHSMSHSFGVKLLGRSLTARSSGEEPCGQPWWQDRSELIRIRTILSRSYNCYWHWPKEDLDLYDAHKNCDFHNISSWPIDAAKIFEDDQHVLVLGSLKSACEIEQVNAKLGITVNIVVTMNAGDTKRTGERPDYGRYYQQLCIRNFRYDGYDTTNLTGEDYATKQLEYKSRWKTMCEDLDAAFAPKGKITILFHCFAGVHRSSSALCAFLILRKTYSTETAVSALVKCRPGQQYWKKREYFIDALIDIAIPSYRQ